MSYVSVPGFCQPTTCTKVRVREGIVNLHVTSAVPKFSFLIDSCLSIGCAVCVDRVQQLTQHVLVVSYVERVSILKECGLAVCELACLTRLGRNVTARWYRFELIVRHKF